MSSKCNQLSRVKNFSSSGTSTSVGHLDVIKMSRQKKSTPNFNLTPFAGITNSLGEIRHEAYFKSACQLV